MRSMRLFVFASVVLLAKSLFAGVPLQVNHQGLVTVGGSLFDGNGCFRFAFVDPDANENRWTNDGTNVPGPGVPTNCVSLPVINGIYNVRLGDPTLPNMTAIPSTVFNDDNIVLRIWFDDGQGGGNQQLSPDHVLTAAPYAFAALSAQTASFATTAGDADAVDGRHYSDIATEIDLDIAVHASDASAHHARYTDTEAITAVCGGGGCPGGGSIEVSEVRIDSSTISSTSFVDIPALSITIQASSASDVFVIMYSSMHRHNTNNGAWAMLAIDGSNENGTERGTWAHGSPIYHSQGSQIRYAPGDTNPHTVTGRARVTSSTITVEDAVITIMRIPQ